MVIVGIVSANHAVGKPTDLLLYIAKWTVIVVVSFVLFKGLAAPHVLLLSQHVLTDGVEVHINNFEARILLEDHKLHVIK